MLKSTRVTLVSAAFFVLAMGGAFCAETAKPDAGQVEADKKALQPILLYVGGWRGSGFAKDGSSKDGWGEESEWQFDLKGGHAALTFTSDKGKYYKSGRIEPGEKSGTFKFTGILPDGKTKEILSGEIATDGPDKGDLVLDNPAPGEGRPARVDFNLVAKGKRMNVYYQRKTPGAKYVAMSEVGYTLKGSGFGQQSDAHECIITGGTGKIQVSYKGKDYWVCCGGCRDAFNENPEKEIAAYLKRKEEEKAKDKK